MIRTQFDENEAEQMEFALKSQMAEMATFIFGESGSESNKEKYVAQARALRKVLLANLGEKYVPLLDFGVQSGGRVSDELGMTEENKAGNIAYRC